MTQDQLQSLRAEILERIPQALRDTRDTRDTQAIADALSAGRTRPTMREIGNGLVLETLGLEVGNRVLDLVRDTEALRHVRPLLEQGRLVASSALVGEWLDGLVTGGALERGQADAVVALGHEPAPVSEYEVRCACWSDAGEWMA